MCPLTLEPLKHKSNKDTTCVFSIPESTGTVLLAYKGMLKEGHTGMISFRLLAFDCTNEHISKVTNILMNVISCIATGHDSGL